MDVDINAFYQQTPDISAFYPDSKPDVRIDRAPQIDASAPAPIGTIGQGDTRGREDQAELTGYQVAFLAAYSRNLNVQAAAEAAGIHRNTHYEWMKRSEFYRAAYEQARVEATDFMEAAAVERAVRGVQEPVFHEGKVCGHVVRYSDRLLERLLTGNKPAVYRDRVDLTGKDGAPLMNVSMMDKILREGDGS